MSNEEASYDFFVSYSRTDNHQEWISQFVDQLIAEHRAFSGGRELTCFFDKKEIRAFDDWRLRILDGIQHSGVFLAFVSPSYLGSKYCRGEWKAWIDKEISGQILSRGALSIYIVEVPGFLGKNEKPDREVAELIGQMSSAAEADTNSLEDTTRVVTQIRRRQLSVAAPFFTQGIEALRREDLRSLLRDLASNLQTQSTEAKRAALSPTTVPVYNRRFTGRLGELLAVREQLIDDPAGAICGIAGLGGMGKSELAFTYAHAFAGDYPGGRFEVRCEGKSSLRDALISTTSLTALFRARLTDSQLTNPDTCVSALLVWLRERIDQHGRVLLILDNVTTLDMVSREERSLLTTLGGALHLLVTTRLLPSNWTDWITLDELSEDDSLNLLEKHRPLDNPDERIAAVRIVQRLGGVPLAIELVAAWLEVHRDVPVAGFLSRLEAERLDALETVADDKEVRLSGHNHERKLSAVLAPTLAGLEPLHQRLVGYAACLPADAVALPWLRMLVRDEFPEVEFSNRPGYPSVWETACRHLARLSLFSRSDRHLGERTLVRMHRLVQEFVSRQHSTAAVKRQQQTRELVCARAEYASLPASWVAENRWELRAATAAADQWMKMADGLGIEIAANITRALLAHNYYSEAHSLMQVALKVGPTLLGTEHPIIGVCVNNQADLLREMNRLEEAEALARSACDIHRNHFGKTHWHLARDLNNLGLILDAQGNLSEAEATYDLAMQALPGNGTLQERIHIPIINLNRASLLCRKERYEQAISLLTQAASDFAEILGSVHPYVANALNNLGVALHAVGRLDDAERNYAQAAVVYEKCLGGRSLRFATTTYHHAVLLADMRRYEPASQLTRIALDILLDVSLLEGRDDLFLRRVEQDFRRFLQWAGKTKEEVRVECQKHGVSAEDLDSTGHQAWLPRRILQFILAPLERHLRKFARKR